MREDGVRSLERGLALLGCFDLETDELSLAQFAERTGLPGTTVYRMVNGLAILGYLERGAGKTYRLGSRTYLLGAVAQRQYRLSRVAEPLLRSLRDATSEAISLYALEDGCRVCYLHLESRLSMRCVVRVGDRFPLWAGAAGKCLLAYATDEQIQRAMGELAAITPSTIVEHQRFMAELASIRAEEQAISHGEREVDIVSVAVPIFLRRNEVRYALSLALPAARADAEILKDHIAALKRTARLMAGQLDA